MNISARKQTAGALLGLAIAFFTLAGPQNAYRPLMAYALVLLMPLVILLTGVTRHVWIAAAFLLFVGVAIRGASYDSEYIGSDVLLLTDEAIEVLLDGNNPYEHDFTVSKNTPAYPPGYLFVYLPGHLLNEIRLTEILSAGVILVGFAWIAHLIKDDGPVAAMGLYASAPPLLALTIDGSNDTSMGAFLFVTLVLTFVARRNSSGAILLLSGALMGATLAFKQYAFPFWPLVIAYLFNQRWRLDLKLGSRSFRVPAWTVYGATSAAVAALIVLPFFLWSPRDFVHDLLLFSSTTVHPIVEGWNVWAFLLRWQGWNADTWGAKGLLPTLDVGLMVVVILVGLMLGTRRPSYTLTWGVAAWFVLMFFARWTTYAYFAGIAPVAMLIPFADRLVQAPGERLGELAVKE